MYISDFPADVREIMTQIRGIIKKAAPDAVENIAYGMPAYKTNGKPLVGIIHLDFKPVQFPLNKPVPYDLIKRIVEFRAEENFLKKKK